MPLIGFKKRFAPMVESGKKRQTIRAKRRDGRNPHPGETLYLYTGLRTKGCRKIGQVFCKSVTEIVVTRRGIILAGEWVTSAEADQIAIADGFGSYSELWDFVEREHHMMSIEDTSGFWGLLIKWEMEKVTP